MGEFITFIIWAAIIQGLLLGVIFIISRKHRSFANRLLGSFLLAFVFGALTDLLPINKIGNYSLSGYFTLPEVKMLLPVLFLHFVLEKIVRTSAYGRFLKIHYLLAFGFIGITLVNVLLVIFFGHSLLDYLGWSILEPFYMGFQYYAFILTVVSFGIALLETRRYQKRVSNEFTDLTLLNIKWLWQFIFIIAPIILFWGVELVRIVMGGMGQSELTVIAYAFIAIFNYFVSYKAFTQQNLFVYYVDAMNSSAVDPVDTVKPRTPIDNEVCLKIKVEMKDKEYYLDQDLTIHDFAKKINIPVRTISSCINQSLGQNFNVWVNNYRVEKAISLLEDKKHNHLSIEGIGSEVGFKSRSAMYTAFQKTIGQSPGNFRTV